jgi:uncharacterized protein YaaN involved in tellurite resistance
MTTESKTQNENELLNLSTPAALKEELGLKPVEVLPEQLPQIDPELDRKANQFVDAVLSIKPNDPEDQASKKALIDSMGVDTQRAAAHRSKMLEKPIRALSQNGADGGPVADSLVELKTEVDELNPNDIDLSPSGFAKLLGKIPGFGSALERYFLKYASAQELIDQIIKSLEAGRDQLKRDNATLEQDQVVMRQLTRQLERLIQLGLLLDEKLAYKMEREMTKEDPRYAFIAEELVFPLRQRIQDLQQQLAVNQQGILAIELIIRNNRELIRGVDRAINVTVSALSVAVTVALALANQKLVLDKISALNKTTSSLISGTASRLRTQGVEIHKQASETMLNMEDLKSAFEDITAALDEISGYRQKALPEMAAQIDALGKLNAQGEQSIRKMEEGNKVSPKLADLELGSTGNS